MPYYEFEIIEKLRITVEIEADSYEEAEHKVIRDYGDETIRLERGDYFDHEIKYKP